MYRAFLITIGRNIVAVSNFFVNAKWIINIIIIKNVKRAQIPSILFYSKLGNSHYINSIVARNYLALKIMKFFSANGRYTIDSVLINVTKKFPQMSKWLKLDD